MNQISKTNMNIAFISYERILFYFISLSWIYKCDGQSYYSFWANQGSWRNVRCDPGASQPLQEVVSLDFPVRETEPCTCLLYRPSNNPWEANNGIMLQRYSGGSWTTLRNYEYRQWLDREGGALRVRLQSRSIYIYLNDREEPWNWGTDTLKISATEGFTLTCSSDASISYTSPGQTTTTSTTTTTTRTTQRPITTTTTPSNRPPTPPDQTDPPQESNTSPSISTTRNSGDPEPLVTEKPDDKQQDIILYAGIGAAVFLALVILIIIIVCVCSKGKKKSSKDDTALTANGEEPNQDDQASSGYHSNLAYVNTETMIENEKTKRNSKNSPTNVKNEKTNRNSKNSPTNMEKRRASDTSDPSLKSILKKTPKVSMNTKHSPSADEDSANESNTTDSSMDLYDQQPDGKSLHAEDIEFVGGKKRVRGFRKVKKHRNRSTILRKNSKAKNLSDSETESTRDSRRDDGNQGDTENTDVSNNSYEDIDLADLANLPDTDDDDSDYEIK